MRIPFKCPFCSEISFMVPGATPMLRHECRAIHVYNHGVRVRFEVSAHRTDGGDP